MLSALADLKKKLPPQQGSHSLTCTVTYITYDAHGCTPCAFVVQHFSSTWYSCPCPRLQQGYSFALQRGLCSQSLAKVLESLQDVPTVECEGFGAGTYFDLFCDVLF